MIRVRVDTSVLDAKLAKLRANRIDARRESTAVLANEVIRFIVDKAPRDTNRYVRGWQQAQNDISRGGTTVAPVPLSVIKPGRYAAGILTRIRKQSSYWTAVRIKLQHRVDDLRRAGVKDNGPRMTRALATLEKVKAIEERAKESLRFMQENPDTATHAILIGGKRTQNPYAFGRLARVDAKFHGGFARFYSVGNQTYIEVKNLEPHANIVESRTQLMRTALGAVKAYGFRSIRGAYIKQLTSNVAVMLPNGRSR